MKRKKIYLVIVLALSLFTVYSQTIRQVETPGSLKSHTFKMNQVKLTEGRFKDAERADVEYLLQLEPDRLLSGFFSEAGLTPKAPKYGGWESQGNAGQTIGFYLSACATYYATSGDKRFLERLNYIIDELEICQKVHGNGYLSAMPNAKHIYAEVAAGDIRSQGFDLNGGWVPIYVMHKLLAGLIDAYQQAGIVKALEIASQIGDFLYKTFAHLTEDQMQKVLACEFGGMNEALADLYALTLNEKHLQIAKRFDNHKAVIDSLACETDDLEGKHANTQVPKIVGSARLYELTGSKRDSIIATFFWNTVVRNHTYINGGNSNGEHFGEPGKLNNRLGTSTTETCNTFNMLKLTSHLFSWGSNPQYADYCERAVYNHILSSQNVNDGMCVYYTPLVSGGKKSYLSPFNSFVCCTGTGMVNHVKYASFIYSEGVDTSLFINLFIPSELDWKSKNIKLTQSTTLPSSNVSTIKFETASPQKATIRIRYPHWTKSISFKLNGKKVRLNTNASKGNYISIENTWKQNDLLEIIFEQEIYTVSMPDNPKRVGIFYGPVLLSGELGEKEPDPETGVPVLVTNKPIEKQLKILSYNPLKFQMENVGRPFDPVLIPFYDICHHHYMVYWDIFTEKEWKSEQVNFQEEKMRIYQLEKITTDYISLGEMQPERDHNFRAHSVGNGMFNKKKWRAAWTGGWFEFDMKVKENQESKLIVTYWGEESPEKEFDIIIEGTKIARQKIYMNKPGAFFEITYPIPAELTKGKTKVTIRFESAPYNWTGAIYNCRIVNE